jgi:hypothetical protein
VIKVTRAKQVQQVLPEQTVQRWIGNGKTISGLKVSNTIAYAGFLGYISAATVKNIKVSDGIVTGTLLEVL